MRNNIWLRYLKNFGLWLVGLAMFFFVTVGITYSLGTLPEILGVKGAALQWWMWGLRVIVASFFVAAGFWVIFHPLRTRHFLRNARIWLWGKVSRKKELEAIAQSKPEPKAEANFAPVSRRRFLVEGSALTAFAVDSFLIEPNGPTIVNLEIKIPNLPPAFNGLTIAQLSDIHIDPYTTAEDVARIVEQVNALKPDLTVVTGDFISRGTYYFEMAAETLGKLRDGARLGVYGSSGNHDHWSDGSDLGRIEPLFAKNGLPLLRNTATELKLNGDSLWLLGTDDSSTHNDDLGKTIRALGYRTIETAKNDTRPKILLSHNPNFIEQAQGLGNTFMLSGHTHGGQVYVPALADAALWPIYPRFRGYYKLDNLLVYVNNGFGTVGPPFRFLTRPEIAVFKLIAA